MRPHSFIRRRGNRTIRWSLLEYESRGLGSNPLNGAGDLLHASLCRSVRLLVPRSCEAAARSRRWVEILFRASDDDGNIKPRERGPASPDAFAWKTS